MPVSTIHISYSYRRVHEEGRAVWCGRWRGPPALVEAGVLEEGTPKHTGITDARIHHILVGVCAPKVRTQGITEIMES